MDVRGRDRTWALRRLGDGGPSDLPHPVFVENTADADFVTRYSIVPERSQVWIDARSNVHPIHSSTTGLEGYVELDMEPSGSIATDAAAGQLSLAVDHLKSGNRMEDRELQKRIDARKFPRIEGQLERIAPNGSDAGYRVSGEVKFRGVSRPHEDSMEITTVDDRTIRLAGASSFDIRDFGMQPPKVLLLKVEPEVQVRVEIFAVKDE
jgi:polyisoprenoid-binding protein YceI